MVWPRTDASRLAVRQTGEPSVCAGRTDRSTTMAMRRLAAASGSAGTSGSRSALPVTLRMRGSCRPASTSSRRVALARSADNSQLVRPATGERRRVGVAGDRDVLRQAHQHRRDLLQQQPRAVVGDRRTERKHRLAIVVEDLDAQPLGRHVDRELPCQFRQFRIAAHGLANLLRRLLECLLFPSFQFRPQLSLGRRSLRVALPCRRR